MRTVVFESFEILDVGPFSLERNEELVGGHLWSKVMVDLGQLYESTNLSVSLRICPYNPILSPHWAWPVSPVAPTVRDQICEQHRGQAVARGEAELILWGWTIMGEGFRQTYTGDSPHVFPGVEIAWPSAPLPWFSLLLENNPEK